MLQKYFCLNFMICLFILQCSSLKEWNYKEGDNNEFGDNGDSTNGNGGNSSVRETGRMGMAISEQLLPRYTMLQEHFVLDPSNPLSDLLAILTQSGKTFGDLHRAISGISPENFVTFSPNNNFSLKLHVGHVLSLAGEHVFNPYILESKLNDGITTLSSMLSTPDDVVGLTPIMLGLMYPNASLIENMQGRYNDSSAISIGSINNLLNIKLFEEVNVMANDMIPNEDNPHNWNEDERYWSRNPKKAFTYTLLDERQDDDRHSYLTYLFVRNQDENFVSSFHDLEYIIQKQIEDEAIASGPSTNNQTVNFGDDFKSLKVSPTCNDIQTGLTYVGTTRKMVIREEHCLIGHASLSIYMSIMHGDKSYWEKDLEIGSDDESWIPKNRIPFQVNALYKDAFEKLLR